MCSYDRAGFAWSDPSRNARSAPQIADDSNALLSKAEIPPPYVLVGHSMGGLYVRAFTRKDPSSVAGMVMVDATHEDQWDFEPTRRRTPSGVITIVPKQPEIQRPPAVAAILSQMWATEQWKADERAERQAIKATVDDAQQHSKRLPAISRVVLLAGVEAGSYDNAPLELLKTQQLHREMAAYSPLGKWIAVPGQITTSTCRSPRSS